MKEELNTSSIISPRPFGLFNIELTNRCPMKCVMCPRTYHMTREQGFMDFSLFKKIIDELAETNPSFINDKAIWLHHFGESLLHPQFELFIRYAAEKRVRTGLSVNPVMLDKDNTASLLGSGLHILYLSLDGHDDESFYKIRGMKNAYSRSRENVLQFLEEKRKNPGSMKTVLSMIDFSLNENSASAARDEWESHEGIDSFLLKNYTTWDGTVSEISKLSPMRLKQQSRCTGPATCTFPFENMTVTWDGDVVPCCFDYNKKIVLGNAASHTLGSIWNGRPMQLLRGEFLSGNVTNPLCKQCENLRA